MIENLIAEKKFIDAIDICLANNFHDLARLISFSFENTSKIEEVQVKQDDQKTAEEDDKKKVLLMCNWCSSEHLINTWNKMSENLNKSWKNITLVSQEPCDFYCIINKPPPDVSYDPKRTIIFRMEPHMERDSNQWGEFAKPDPKNFFFVGQHDLHFNNNEYHLSKTYSQLLNEPITKNIDLSNILSTVLSDKYKDPGHIKRVDFIKYIENKMEVHVFGSDKFLWKNYKGSLPYHEKDNAMFPYKYTFNVENHSIKNYYTEKLIDGILAESLVFYSGCFNVRDYIDERAFVYLELSNFEKDFNTIKKAIEEDWWSKRLPYIKLAKQKILNELQFFPRLHSIINSSSASHHQTSFYNSLPTA